MENITININYVEGEPILPQNVVVRKNDKLVSGIQQLKLNADTNNPNVELSISLNKS